ncbi:MAG: hypothetical protein WA624_16860, partial [Methylocella sp.]
RWAHHNTILCGNGLTLKGTTRIMPDNGIAERFHKTVLNEFYRIAFCKNIHAAIGEPRKALDALVTEQNEVRTH